MGKTALLATKEWASRCLARPNLKFLAPHNQRIAPVLRSHRPSRSAKSKRFLHLISLLVPNKIPRGAQKYSRVFSKWNTCVRIFNTTACMNMASMRFELLAAPAARLQASCFAAVRCGILPAKALAQSASAPTRYLMILATTPAPTVRPPSRIANRRPSSIAIGWIRLTTILMLSPGMTISTPSGSCTLPVTSVVRK